jgi:hypothetical protein
MATFPKIPYVMKYFDTLLYQIDKPITTPDVLKYAAIHWGGEHGSMVFYRRFGTVTV